MPGLRWVSGIFAMRFRTQTVVKKIITRAWNDTYKIDKEGEGMNKGRDAACVSLFVWQRS